MDFSIVKQTLINEAQRRGLDEYEIFFTQSEQLSTETLKDEICSFSSGVGSGVSFRCIVDGRMGNAATELFTEEELVSLVKRAMDNASVIENDDPVFIFEGSDKYETVEKPNFDMPSTAKIRELALDIQAKTYAQSDAVTDGTQSNVFAMSTRRELINSKGLELSDTVKLGGAFAQAVVKQSDEAQEAYDFVIGYDGVDTLPKKAVDKALSKIGATDVKSGKYNIIIDGAQMRSLLATYSSAFSGKQALLGLSLLAGKVGEKIAADCVTLVDDPRLDGSFAQTSFDGEGVATYKKNVIENGVLKTLLYDLSTAAKAGVKTTANGQRSSYANQVGIAPFAFYIEGGEVSEEELLAKMGDGIYLAELKGLHAGANAVTGDFSLESAGYLVENGKKIKAIKGFTVAGNFFELLSSIKQLSDNVKFGMPSGLTTFGSPDVLLENVSVAGV
ncbi:MAG: TldD/PmbA family protein [Ruminococcaceae bacterium]|nr:TldD/PmbA family protein [Oscillospiraceae bacterium]